MDETTYIGTRFYKNSYSQEEYTVCAVWCNETQKAMIKDMGDYYECVEIPQMTFSEKAMIEIEQLKQYLLETDYIYAKCSELNLDVKTEYLEIVTKRIESRNRINELEKLIQGYH